MAGNYMDAPAPRLAWDRDGSILVVVNGSSIEQQSANTMRILNSEDDASATLPTGDVTVLFPVPVDLYAWFIATDSGNATEDEYFTLQVSSDSSNGEDGDWSEVLATLPETDAARPVKPNYRVDGEVLSLLSPQMAVRGVRLGGSGVKPLLRAFHLYGFVSSTAPTDRLAMWQPTSDVKVTPTWFDWGDTPQSSSADKKFRIKNLSSTLTATDISVYVQALTPGVPSVAGMHTLSLDDVNFSPNLLISSLAPGALSDVITVRRTVPANAQISVWSARLAADVYEWTEE